MANFCNGKVFEIGVDFGTKKSDSHARRDMTKSVDIIKQERNLMFMTRKQLCKHLNIK